jgi:hypothetical protein
VCCIIGLAGQAPHRWSRVTSNVRRRTLHRVPCLAAAVSLLALLHACDRPPQLVYVLQAPQSIELAASASHQTAKVGEPVVLHAARTTQGVWRQIQAKDLAADQCWMVAVPPVKEPEVADNVLWRVEPASGVRFNTDFRRNRTREVTIDRPGTYTLRASTGAWCELGRTVVATPVQLSVVGQ